MPYTMAYNYGSVLEHPGFMSQQIWLRLMAILSKHVKQTVEVNAVKQMINALLRFVPGSR